MTPLFKRSTFLAAFLVLVMIGCATANEKTDASAPATQPVQKPAIVPASDWNSTPDPIGDERKHTPKYITIHHAGVLWTNKATPPTMIKNMQTWGKKEKKWPDVPYHFLIGPDGTIYEGRSLEYEPDTNTKYEVSGHIGVELMGNFEEQRMSEAQLNSLVNVTAWLAQEFKIDPPNIGGHKDAAPDQTTCPGKDLYRYIVDGTIAKWTTAMRAGEQPEIVYREALPDGPMEIITLKPPTSQSAK